MSNAIKRRLVIVSNRLPFTAWAEGKKLRFRESAGGLAVGLSTFLHSIGSSAAVDDYVWIGWPGTTIPESMHRALEEESRARFQSVPIHLSEEEMDLFYHGFCNETIWPLFHYFPSYTIYREDFWRQYKKVNLLFAGAVSEVLQPNDVVWVHDYHLMLLPQLLRAQAPHLPVGFFLHIPFPSFEIFRLIPGKWRREILEGLLGADLVGFHTYEYTQHFLQTVLRLHGTGNTMGKIFTSERMVKVETFPMGIDFNHFDKAVQSPEVKLEREKLSGTLPGAKVILSVDRLDYTKGILNRLLGFELLLETHSSYRSKVVLIMIVVPSRSGVEQYEMMKRQIEELVGRINGKFGNVAWTPVVYQYRHVPFHPLVAFYTMSDVALVTPLRDGMNLVAKEYVATRGDGSGVLILSEMAGAVTELGEAVIVNPNDREAIADALREALEMPIEEQKRRNEIMRHRIKYYDVARWANEFVSQLISTQDAQQTYFAKWLSETGRKSIVEAYKKSHRPGIFLDYDGTLSPFVRHPEQALPTQHLRELLCLLGSHPKASVTIISGRDKGTLQQWFHDVPVRLVAEHGVWIREKNGEWRMTKLLDNRWKANVMPIFELYSTRLPGSFVEEKEYSVVWHYRGSDPEHGASLAGELMDNIMSYTANIDVQVLQGNKIIEARAIGVTKGSIGQELLASEEFDFVLFVGDDWTDEDLFKVLPPSAFSIKVGMATTHARFMVHSVDDVLALLGELANENTPQSPTPKAALRQP